MPEIWKDIPLFEGKYQVSNLGRVKRLAYTWTTKYMPRNWKNNGRPEIEKIRTSTEKIMNGIDLGGYKRVSLCLGNQKTKHFLVHRLVFCVFNEISLEFQGQKSKTLILHKNDIKSDNRLDNLFIGDQKDNMDDMSRKGRKRNGRAKKVKIGFDDIENIKYKYIELQNIFMVAEIYGVSGATISRVLNGKIWIR